MNLKNVSIKNFPVDVLMSKIDRGEIVPHPRPAAFLQEKVAGGFEYRACIAFDEESAIGFLFYTFKGNTSRIEFAFVDESERNKGIATQMIQSMLNNLPIQTKCIYTHERPDELFVPVAKVISFIVHVPVR